MNENNNKKAVPAGGFKLLPELLKLKIPHILEAENIDRTILLNGLTNGVDNRLFMLSPFLLCL